MTKPPKLPTVVPGSAAIVTVKCPFGGIVPDVDHAPLAPEIAPLLERGKVDSAAAAAGSTRDSGMTLPGNGVPLTKSVTVNPADEKFQFLDNVEGTVYVACHVP